MPWFPFDPPDVPAVPFMELGAGEARRLHDAYVAAHPARLERLRTEVPERGGPAAAALGGDVDGLRRHWEWWVAEDVPLEPRWSEDDLVPFWARQLAGAPSGIGAVSARALLDADLLAAHLAEVALRTYPGAHWALGERADLPRYAFARYTVVAVDGAHLVPLVQSSGLVLRVLAPRPGRRAPDPLRRLEAHLGPLPRASAPGDR